MAKTDDPTTHTAEHILNQSMIRLLGCERSFSTQLSAGKGKVDFHFDRDLTADEVQRVEAMANEQIRQDLAVKNYFLTVAEAGQRMPVDKLPPAIAENPETPIRIVEVDGFDLCPCVGEHLTHTGSIGGLVITGHDFAAGRVRVRFRLGSA